MSQSERIFFINRQLVRHQKVTVRNVAERYEISVRQVKRDIEYLRDRFNAPIVYDSENKTYKYESEFRDLAFADQKIIMFYILTKSLLSNESYIPLYSEELTARLENDVPKDYRSVCDRIIYQSPRSNRIDSEYFTLITDALRDRTCVDIVYTNLKNEQTERHIDPEYIVNYEDSWYLIANDSIRNDLRTFHFSRIKKMSSSNEKIKKRSAEFQKKLNEYIAGGFGIFKGKQTKNVTILFSGYAQKVVESQIWHEKQKLVFVDEGLELTIPVADYREILGKILAFGAEARPVSPPDLCELWKEEVRRMMSTLKEA